MDARSFYGNHSKQRLVKNEAMSLLTKRPAGLMSLTHSEGWNNGSAQRLIIDNHVEISTIIPIIMPSTAGNSKQVGVSQVLPVFKMPLNAGLPERDIFLFSSSSPPPHFVTTRQSRERMCLHACTNDITQSKSERIKTRKFARRK